MSVFQITSASATQGSVTINPDGSLSYSVPADFSARHDHLHHRGHAGDQLGSRQPCSDRGTGRDHDDGGRHADDRRAGQRYRSRGRAAQDHRGHRRYRHRRHPAGGAAVVHGAEGFRRRDHHPLRHRRSRRVHRRWHGDGDGDAIRSGRPAPGGGRRPGHRGGRRHGTDRRAAQRRRPRGRGADALDRHRRPGSGLHHAGGHAVLHGARRFPGDRDDHL